MFNRSTSKLFESARMHRRFSTENVKAPNSSPPKGASSPPTDAPETDTYKLFTIRNGMFVFGAIGGIYTMIMTDSARCEKIEQRIEARYERKFARRVNERVEKELTVRLGQLGVQLVGYTRK